MKKRTTLKATVNGADYYHQFRAKLPGTAGFSFMKPIRRRVTEWTCLIESLASSLGLLAGLSGTAHILLGLLREGDGVAGNVLKGLGVNLETTRDEILRELDPNYTSGKIDGDMPS